MSELRTWCRPLAGMSVAISLFLACEVPFSPKGPFFDSYAVYAILSDRTDSLIVRIVRTYDPGGFDPFARDADEAVSGASVGISVGAGTTFLRETTFARTDTSRYKTPVIAYIAHPFPVERSHPYTLAVITSEGKLLSATTSVPGSGSVGVGNPLLVINPSLSGSAIIVHATLSPLAQGFLIRLFVRFEAQEAGGWIRYSREIPQRVEMAGTVLERWYMPELARKSSNEGSSNEVVSFQLDAYRRGLGAISEEFAGKTIRNREAVFVLAQVDLHLYNYYNVVRGFRDPWSLRVDEADYSNVNGGVGMFGALVHDTVVVALP